MASREAPVAGLAEIDHEKCVRLVRPAAKGRVVLGAGCRPVPTPVDVSVLHGPVMLSTGTGSKPAAAPNHA